MLAVQQKHHLPQIHAPQGVSDDGKRCHVWSAGGHLEQLLLQAPPCGFNAVESAEARPFAFEQCTSASAPPLPSISRAVWTKSWPLPFRPWTRNIRCLPVLPAVPEGVAMDGTAAVWWLSPSLKSQGRWGTCNSCTAVPPQNHSRVDASTTRSAFGPRGYEIRIFFLRTQ